MSYATRLAYSSVLALSLPATTALADLSAADVWADWTAYFASYGYTVTATERSAGGTLTLTDLQMATTMANPAGEDRITVSFNTMRLVETADGAVKIEFPDAPVLRMAIDMAAGEDTDFALRLTPTNPSMIVTGTPDDLTYTYTADALGIALEDLVVDDVAIPSEVARFDLGLTDVSYVTTTTVGALRSFTQDMTAASLTYDMQIAAPDAAEGQFKMSGQINQPVSTSAGTLPAEMKPEDFNATLNDGFDLDAGFRSAGGQFSVSFSSPDGSGTANGSASAGEVSMSLSSEGLRYGLTQQGVDMNALVTEFPLPLSFSASELGTNLFVPLQKAPQSQDFGLGLSLIDVTISNAIWGIFDPSGQLPRDPATLLVDLSGKAKVIFDMLDPVQAAVLEDTGAMPGDLEAVTLNTLEVDAVGARLEGKGDFVFDNSDTTTFGGMPRPEGALDLQLRGGNGLIDTLVAMGLVPEEQAMGARMMMGIFAVPGDTPDSLTSRIEVTPDGQVLANGQRIR